MRNYVHELPRVAMTDVEISKHAIERALDMGVEGEEITAALTRPERGYWSRSHEAWCSTAGRVSVGYREDAHDPSRFVLTTVLWASEEAWEDDAARAPLVGGRTLKPGWMT